MTTEAMSPARFEALDGSFGGTIARWPEAQRAAARTHASKDAGEAVLHSATEVDSWLDGYVLDTPRRGLRRHAFTRRSHASFAEPARPGSRANLSPAPEALT